MTMIDKLKSAAMPILAAGAVFAGTGVANAAPHGGPSPTKTFQRIVAREGAHALGGLLGGVAEVAVAKTAQAVGVAPAVTQVVSGAVAVGGVVSGGGVIVGANTPADVANAMWRSRNANPGVSVAAPAWFTTPAPAVIPPTSCGKIVGSRNPADVAAAMARTRNVNPGHSY